MGVGPKGTSHEEYQPRSIIALLSLALAPQAGAGTISYLLRTPTAAQAQTVCQRYNLQLVGNLGHPDVFMVQASDALSPDVLKQWVKNDSDVENLEVDRHANVVETAPLPGAYIPSLPITDYVTDGKLTQLYGTTAWGGYVQQPAMNLTNAVSAIQQNLI